MDGVKFGDLFFDAGHQAASFCSISVRLTGSDGEACIACFFRLNSAMASIASFNVSCGNSLTWERPYFSQNLIDESSASSSSARRRLRSSIVMRFAPASSHSTNWHPVCSVIGSGVLSENRRVRSLLTVAKCLSCSISSSTVISYSKPSRLIGARLICCGTCLPFRSVSTKSCLERIVTRICSGLCNSYTACAEVTPRHNAFVEALLQSPLHILGTMRCKQDFVLTDRNGKQVPQKVGLAPLQRDGFEYEMTVVLDIEQDRHLATVSTDRTRLFSHSTPEPITEQTGRQLMEWLEAGANHITIDERNRILALLDDAELSSIKFCEKYGLSYVR